MIFLFGMCVRVQIQQFHKLRPESLLEQRTDVSFQHVCEGTIQQLHNLRAESHLEERNDCSFRYVWEGGIQQFHKLRADSQLEQRNDCSFRHVWESAIQQFGLLGTESPGGYFPCHSSMELWNWIRNGPCPTTPMKLNFIAQTSHSVHVLGYYDVREIFKWIPFKTQSTWGM
jgi:hypothetical protein